MEIGNDKTCALGFGLRGLQFGLPVIAADVAAFRGDII
jgi:hypothetical protein